MTSDRSTRPSCTRRNFLAATMAAGGACALPRLARGAEREKAQIAITLDLEMSRHYPRRGMTEWDFQKGNLDEPTKQYAVEAARIVKERGGVIHFFCVGRVLEQADIGWLQSIAAAGHPIGNHTYDHVNVHARSPQETQFRFQRAPWLVEGKSTAEIIRENVRLTSIGLAERAQIDECGFRTPGGFADGIGARPDLQQMFLDLGYSWISSKYPRHAAGQPHEAPAAEVYDSIVAAQQDAQPFVYPSGLIEIPMSPISDVGAFRSKFWKREWFLQAIGLAVDWAIENRAVFDFLAHPSCLVVEDPEFETIKLICDKVNTAQERAEIVGLDAIAAGVAAGK